jgi:hypothetical protein
MMKAISVLIVMGLVNGPALAQTRQVAGTAGYLSEWELAATVTKNTSAAGGEFSGPIVWKHVGLCSVNGPEEIRGEIKFQIRRSWLSSKFEASLSLDGDECTYSGEFFDGTSGLMDCAKAKGVPLTLSVR